VLQEGLGHEELRRKYVFQALPEEDAKRLRDRVKAMLDEDPKVLEKIRTVPSRDSIFQGVHREGYRDAMIKNISLTQANTLAMKKALGFENASQPEINRQVVGQMVKLFQRRNGDSGSSEVQSRLEPCVCIDVVQLLC